MEAIDDHLQKIEDKVNAVLANAPQPKSHRRKIRYKKGDPLARYNVGIKASNRFTFGDFIQKNPEDPATKVSVQIYID